MLRFGIVGCGRIAKRHAELLGLEQVARASLGAVCDIDSAKARAFGERFNVPWFTDLDTMMRESALDAVSVLTPSGMHADHVVALARYGKPIIVEKPMALTLVDADRMLAACDATGAALHVVKQNRFNVPIVKLREALYDGRFGKLVIGTIRVRWCRRQDYYDQDSWRGTWALDGGVLTNQASHHVDLLQWIMGDVESVFARSTTALADIEAEDTAVAVIKFKNGALGTIEATTASRPTDLEGSVSVLGEHGTVEVGGFAVNKMKVWRFEKEALEDEAIISEFSVNPPNVYGFGHQAYYEHVVACILDGVQPLVDGREARRSLELLHALYESIETGLEVKYPFESRHVRLGQAG
jgi:UDP-N-acetyl-2-amino-2-deoxyglucuronate dehydrogenase